MRKRKKKSVHNDKFLSSKFYQNFTSSKTRLMSSLDKGIIKSSKIDHKKTNTVSSFSGWVFNSFVTPQPFHKLDDGIKLEKILSTDFSKNKFNKYKNIDDEKYRREHYMFLDDEWEMEFEDLSIEEKTKFKISNLTLDGEILYGKPDVVYLNKKTKDRIIIEIKNTSNKIIIPEGGWFNLQCQLWCYSMIDEFKNSPNIFLYGDIRRTIVLNGTNTIISRPSNSNVGWRIRKNHQLNLENKNVENFYKQCLELFEIFGGKINQNGLFGT